MSMAESLEKETEKAEAKSTEVPKPKKCFESDECWDARYTDYLNKDKDMIKDTIKNDQKSGKLKEDIAKMASGENVKWEDSHESDAA